MRVPLSLLGVGLLFSACTGRTQPFSIDLSKPDSGAIDSGFSRIDAGVVDAGQMDSGVPNQCSLGDFMGAFTAVGFGADFFYEGAGFITDDQPLTIELDNGQVLTVVIDPRANIPEDVLDQRVVWLRYGAESRRPGSVAFAINEFSPRGGPGALRFVAWNTGDEIDFSELFEDSDQSLQYLVAECPPADLDGCGAARTNTLRFVSRRRVLDVAAGTIAVEGEVTVGNGHSYQYAELPKCADVPPEWNRGFVAFRPAP